MPTVPLIEEPPKPRAQHKLGLRTALTGRAADRGGHRHSDPPHLVLRRSTECCRCCRAARSSDRRLGPARGASDPERRLVGSEAVRSIFFQEAIKPTDEAKREFIFLA